MERFLTNSLWSSIKVAVKRATRVHAAVAYLHDASHLPLHRGDILVCDASPAAIKADQTSISVLRALRKKGVRLFSFAGLHAKVIVADNTVFASSGNASLNSVNGVLTEAGISSSGPAVVAAARAFIHELVEDPDTIELDAKVLRELSKLPVRKPPAGMRRTGAKGRRNPEASEPTSWIVGSVDLDSDSFPNEASLVKEAEAKIKAELRISDTSWIRWAGGSKFRAMARAGAQIIVISRRTTPKNCAPYAVSPPSAILLRQVDPKGKWTRFYYDPDLVLPLRTLDWKSFQSLAKKAGVPRRLTRHSTFAVDDDVMEELNRLWPRKRLAKR